MSTEVKLVEGVAFKLEPDKKYLLIFDRHTVRINDVVKLGELIKKKGINSLALLLNGDPKTVQIIEDNRKATEEKDGHN